MNILIKQCVCGKAFDKPYTCGLPQWEKRKFCSHQCYAKDKLGKTTWNKGLKLPPHSIEHKQKISLAMQGGNSGSFTKGLTPWNRGKKGTFKHSEEWKNWMSENMRGEKCHFWKGGVTSINAVIRTSRKYRNWRIAVFQRDNYTCQHCRIRGNQTGGYLNADHIKPFAYFPELRFEITNGRTLCRDCHRKTETYAQKAKI